MDEEGKEGKLIRIDAKTTIPSVSCAWTQETNALAHLVWIQRISA